MREIYCKCYKIAFRIFLPKEGEWRNYVHISNDEVEKILKYSCEEKEIYVFRFGCVSFLNFKDDEIKLAVSYIKSTFETDDFIESYEHIESARAYFGENDGKHRLSYDAQCKKAFRQLAPIMLAKSVELNKLENELESLVDESEAVIELISKNKYKFFNKRLTSAMTRIIKYNFDILINESALDDVRLCYDQNLRTVSDDLAQYFELDDRQRIFKIKLGNIKNLVNNYRERSFVSNMVAYYRLEIILLMLFPISGILRRNPDYLEAVYNGVVFLFSSILK